MRHEIEIEVTGFSWQEPDLAAESEAGLEVTVSIPTKNQHRKFKFKSTVSNTDVVPLGPFVTNTALTLPCNVALQGQPALECVGTCRIEARRIQFDTLELIVRGTPNSAGTGDSGLFTDVEWAQGHANSVSVKGGKVEITCVEHQLAFPLAKYVQKTESVPTDPTVAKKFRRLRRILSEFASHSKGGLAKYRDKIEHERVLRGKTGENVLGQLLKRGSPLHGPKVLLRRCG